LLSLQELQREVEWKIHGFKSTPALFTVVTNHGGGSPTKKGKSEIDQLVENKTM
jgi:hypothetical protein